MKKVFKILGAVAAVAGVAITVKEVVETVMNKKDKECDLFKNSEPEESVGEYYGDFDLSSDEMHEMFADEEDEHNSLFKDKDVDINKPMFAGEDTEDSRSKTAKSIDLFLRSGQQL